MRRIGGRSPTVRIASSAALIAIGFCAMKPDGCAVAVYLAGVALVAFGFGAIGERCKKLHHHQGGGR